MIRPYPRPACGDSGGGAGRRGDPAVRAPSRRPRAGAGPRPPRHAEVPEQPRRRLPGDQPV